MKFVALALAAASSALALPSQVPFTSPARSSSPFLPANTQNDFEVLTHPQFAEHSVRVRTPKGLCDPDVEQKSGYLDTNGRCAFFPA